MLDSKVKEYFYQLSGQRSHILLLTITTLRQLKSPSCQLSIKDMNMISINSDLLSENNPLVCPSFIMIPFTKDNRNCLTTMLPYKYVLIEWLIQSIEENIISKSSKISLEAIVQTKLYRLPRRNQRRHFLSSFQSLSSAFLKPANMVTFLPLDYSKLISIIYYGKKRC